MDHYGIEGTSRASFAVYNTIEEINIFAEHLSNLIHKWKR
jgi:cysteine desulfurase/selenocysteine lyase